MQIFKEEESEQLESKLQEKPATFEEFVKTKEVQEFIKKWKSKGLTHRGIVELLLLAYPWHKTTKGILKRVAKAIKELIGADGFNLELSSLKPPSEKEVEKE